MSESTLQDILLKLEAAQAAFNTQIEKLFGPVSSTDFADEYAALQAVHDELKAFMAPPPADTTVAG